ncbi:hypothetical protein EG329_013078 [Mollisiaceae sp. DMI_Dod_QoI]|nr:hypothetical protein EG329_013078 [Helotiales sp. DMI_Dod_QoI]
MPLYLRKHGEQAKKERQDAIDREKERAKRRDAQKSGPDAELKRKAIEEMANIRDVRKGVKKPPEPPEEGYSDPMYDSIMGCWKSYLVANSSLDGSQWKAWCVDSNKWLTADEYKQGMDFQWAKFLRSKMDPLAKEEWKKIEEEIAE